jgi:hypothetical protein
MKHLSNETVWMTFATACVSAALPLVEYDGSEPSDAVIAGACSSVADAMLSEYKKRFDEAPRPVRPLPARNPAMDL